MERLKQILEAYKNGNNLEQVCRKFGGVSIYIPKVSPEAKEKILEEFNGYNYMFLSYKYNLSERSIRKIIKESKK